jgi:hypothetical protein
MQSVRAPPALFGVFTERFDGRDLVTFGLRGQQRSRVDRKTVEQNRICARKSLFVAKFHTVESQSAQGGEQGGVDGCFDLVVNAVDVEGDVHGNVLCIQVQNAQLLQNYFRRFFNV